jgi:hypothetical protein
MNSFEIVGPQGTFHCEYREVNDYYVYYEAECSNEYVEMFGWLDIDYDDEYCTALNLNLHG